MSETPGQQPATLGIKKPEVTVTPAPSPATKAVTTAPPAKTPAKLEAILADIQQFQDMGSLQVPEGYQAQNAVRAAWLMLQNQENSNSKKILDACTPASIASTIQEMVIKGLNPVKGQCYFVPYGDVLTLSVSYQGKVAMATRAGVKEVNAQLIYEDDDFAFEVNTDTGRKKLVRHTQDWKNIDENKIIGAYAVVVYNDGSTEVDVMNMQQIRTSWAQGPTKGNSPAHQKFPGEMAKKTVKARAVKNVVNSSTDELNLLEDSEETIIVKEKAPAKELKEIRIDANETPKTDAF